MSKPFKTIEQQVHNLLRSDILSGLYRPGDKLRQDEVAARFGVSTTPVREAFRGLRAEGLVSIDANKGVIVKELTVDDVAEIYELRIALEPMLARKAVGSITPESLSAATAIHAQMCAATDPHLWSSLNREFHLKLMTSEEGSRLYDMVKNLLVVAEPYVSLSIFIQPKILQADNEEHGMILDGYHGKDGDHVEKVVKNHLEQTLAAILTTGE
jgi:DNA-binding GntR family transcriptional regulator